MRGPYNLANIPKGRFMIFLIEYDRRHGKIVKKQSFDAVDRAEADKLRLERELEINRAGIKDFEVVLLEAADETAVKLTHRRYFKDVLELADCKIATLTFP